jgi:hypothetical protein
MLKRTLFPSLLVALIAGAAFTSGAGAAPKITSQDSSTTVVQPDPTGGSGPSKLPVQTLTGDVNIQAGGGTWTWTSYGCQVAHMYTGLPGRWPVTASVAEIDPYGNEYIGAARMWVDNVAVLPNGWVDAIVCIDWGGYLNVRIHLTWG